MYEDNIPDSTESQKKNSGLCHQFRVHFQMQKELISKNEFFLYLKMNSKLVT